MNGWQELSDKEHHSGAYLTSSGLKAALKSPAHFALHQRGETEDKPAFAFGRAVHTRVLEPWEFQSRYAVAPKVDRRTKAGKAEYAEFVEASVDKEVISQDDYDLCEQMAASLTANADASKWLNPDADDSFVEQSGVVMDDRYGLLACRPDLRVVGDYIVDLKTCASADGDYMTRALVNFGYALSAAWYTDLARRIDGGEYRFIWVMVEKTAPFAVACYEASPEVLAYGRDKCREALEVIGKCADDNYYPAAYHEGTPMVELPRWAR